MKYKLTICLITCILFKQYAFISYVCPKNNQCLGTDFCSNYKKIKQNEIKAKYLSKTTCFHNNLNFTMGTNEPIFATDGEGPTRLVFLKRFCIDQTEGMVKIINILIKIFFF